jgi:hypothetical protein
VDSSKLRSCVSSLKFTVIALTTVSVAVTVHDEVVIDDDDLMLCVPLCNAKSAMLF